jgi:hypothetical protein
VQRYHICAAHAAADVVEMNGDALRFCQQVRTAVLCKRLLVLPSPLLSLLL